MRFFGRRPALALALAFLAAPAAQAQPRYLQMDEPRFIEVAGQASVEAVPDFARMTLGVTSPGKDAREALAANAKSVNALIDLLKSEGISAADIQTSSLSIAPTLSNPPSGSEAERKITGYNVSNMVTVTERDIPRLGSLVDRAIEAGANALVNISYGENDPGALLDKARPMAFADAKRKADIYAGAAGAKVGRLMRLSEGAGAQPPLFPRAAYARAAAAPPTPIEPGEDRLTVSVTARFELTE